MRYNRLCAEKSCDVRLESFFASEEFKAMLQVLSMIPEKQDYELYESLARLLDNDETAAMIQNRVQLYIDEKR